MNTKTFAINRQNCSIPCRLYAHEARAPERIVVYGHGFGGHKDNRAAQRFADYMIARHRETAVLCFDWPCHGSDTRRTLLLEDCDLYLSLVLAHLRDTGAAEIDAYATSFGGYLFLKYIRDHGSPFRKVALRCPAVPMHRVLCESIASEEAREALRRGRDALVGFDRKIRISRALLDSLEEADLMRADFTPYCDDMLILHGTRDEIVPMADVEAFAAKNRILFLPIEKADHRFQDPARMMEAIKDIECFLTD